MPRFRARSFSPCRREGAAFVDLSPAPDPAPAAPALLRRAIDAYDAFKYEDAAAALDQALGEAERTGAAGLSPADLSDLLLYRALIEKVRGDEGRAWEDLVRAATVQPARTLDPARFPTKVREDFARAADAVKKLPTGAIAVERPDGCDVLADGTRAADPIGPLPHGEHYLRVVCQGFRPYGARLTLAAASLAYAPRLVADAKPDDAAARDLARRRGAKSVLVASVAREGTAPATLWLRELDTATGKQTEDASVSLAPGGAASDTTAAASRFFAKPIGPVVVKTERRWYRSPWLWGAVGAVVATAIILPFALSEAGGDQVTISPGELPW